MSNDERWAAMNKVYEAMDMPPVAASSKDDSARFLLRIAGRDIFTSPRLNRLLGISFCDRLADMIIEKLEEKTREPEKSISDEDLASRWDKLS